MALPARPLLFCKWLTAIDGSLPEPASSLAVPKPSVYWCVRQLDRTGESFTRLACFGRRCRATTEDSVRPISAYSSIR